MKSFFDENSYSKPGFPFKSIPRLRKITATFVRAGFSDFVRSIGLGRFAFFSMGSSSVTEQNAPVRLRECFESLGTTFIKLGQLLASRRDIIPKEYTKEFSKLHSNVPPAEFKEIEPVFQKNWGENWRDLFSSFQETPMGSASIAQVYRGTLKEGQEVILKVKRPGIQRAVKEDVNILSYVAYLLEKYVKVLRPYHPMDVVEQFSRTIFLEMNFSVEANNIRRISDNLKSSDDIILPKVYNHLSNEDILVLEELHGQPLTEVQNSESAELDKALGKIFKCYLQMVFGDGCFHSDLHAGNVLLLPNGKIGLIDFGSVGILNRKTQQILSDMLAALASEDYDRMAFAYLELAPYSESVDPDRFAADLRDLLSPYYGLGLGQVSLGQLLMQSSQIAGRYKIQLPQQLIVFFKSLITLDGLARSVSKDFDFFSLALEFAGELLKLRHDPKKILAEVGHVGQDITSLAMNLPRQLRQLTRRMNSPEGLGWSLRVKDMNQLVSGLNGIGNMAFKGLVCASLVIGASWIYVSDVGGPRFYGFPVMSLVGYGLAFFVYLGKR